MSGIRSAAPRSLRRRRPDRARSWALSPLAGALLAAAIAIGCTAQPAPAGLGSPTASPPPAATSPPAAATASPSAVATETPSPTPTATPEPPLSLDLPESTDPRQVAVSVAPDVPADGDGVITVTVTNESDERIDDLVVRWPTPLAETLFLAPFIPSPERIGPGRVLVQSWTKWVRGPGEYGEPDGTTSLGYGPIEPGQTLDIPIHVTRIAPGPVAFDLQVLARNDLLTLAGNEPAELRVEVP